MEEEQDSWLNGEGSIHSIRQTKDGYQQLMDEVDEQDEDGQGEAVQQIGGDPIWDRIAAKKTKAYTPTHKMQYGTMTGERF